ncbi:hypothetical protein [Rhodoferax sp. PAMC 29310]|uniref:hypothetical protein n=1 Tax=Rhodoferax sp. PAMC 29310 TaxID=2822760 RepID=UPI001B33E6D8|nr:hypothetical protein [Rhodoferax sp. PAMC 29310]
MEIMMKKPSAKHTNKNTTRSGKTLTSNNFDIDDYLDDQNEADEAAGKTSSSKHDGTIKGKSIKVTPVRNAGQSRHKLNHDGLCADKAARLTEAKAGKPSTIKVKQRVMPAQQIMGTTKPYQMNCDKVELNAYMSSQELGAAVERALEMVRDKTLVKSTSKQRHYQNVFKLPFESGAYAMLQMTPTQANIKAQLKLVFNPNPSHMSVIDARLMRRVWKELLGLNATAIARTMLFHRVDICADFEQRIDDLIIDLDGVKVGTRFGLTTANGGTIKSIYMGGVESQHHGVAYDQVASDNYKANVGEVTSRRRSLREDAEIALDATAKGLRIESRRLFKRPVGLSELSKQTDIFGGYKVWEVKRRSGIRMSPEFIHYIDCVRLRGFNGARSWSLANAADRQATKALIESHEKTLRRMVADWWRPEDFNASLLDVLRQSPAWLFLSVLEIKTATV